MPDIEIQGWNIKELAEQSTNQDTDEILKQVLSGGTTKEGSKLPDIEAYQIDSKDEKTND